MFNISVSKNIKRVIKKEGRREKEIGLPYFNKKKVDFSVNEFILPRRMSLKWFEVFILLGKEKKDRGLERFFYWFNFEVFKLLKGVLKLEMDLM